MRGLAAGNGNACWLCCVKCLCCPVSPKYQFADVAMFVGLSIIGCVRHAANAVLRHCYGQPAQLTLDSPLLYFLFWYMEMHYMFMFLLVVAGEIVVKCWVEHSMHAHTLDLGAGAGRARA